MEDDASQASWNTPATTAASSSYCSGDENSTPPTEGMPFTHESKEKMKKFLDDDDELSEVNRLKPIWTSMPVLDLLALARRPSMTSARRAVVTGILNDKHEASEIARLKATWMAMSISELEARLRQLNILRTSRTAIEEIIHDKKNALAHIDRQLSSWMSMSAQALKTHLHRVDVPPSDRTKIQEIIEVKLHLERNRLRGSSSGYVEHSSLCRVSPDFRVEARLLSSSRISLLSIIPCHEMRSSVFILGKCTCSSVRGSTDTEDIGCHDTLAGSPFLLCPRHVSIPSFSCAIHSGWHQVANTETKGEGLFSFIHLFIRQH